MLKPIMPKATAVWLVDNTTLTFQQIADFTAMHVLEIQGIADGEVATGVKGFDPILNNQLTEEELAKAVADPSHKLKLKAIPMAEGERKRQGARFTPMLRRQEKPAAIYWLVKNHPELNDAQISKLVGTTKPTITSIRDRTHWNINNMTPIDPVAIGICSQTELDEVVAKAASKIAPSEDDNSGETLMPTGISLEKAAENSANKLAAFENFTMSSDNHKSDDEEKDIDPNAFFKGLE